MKQFYFLFFLFINVMYCVAQNNYIQLKNNYNHDIRKVNIHKEVICKVKNERGKLLASLIDVKNDTLIFLENYTHDTIKICWNKLKWFRFKRNAFGSIVYDSWMVTNCGLTAVGALFMYAGFTAKGGGEGGAGYIAAIGLGLFVFTLPQTLFSTINRFKKYTPEEYQIRMR